MREHVGSQAGNRYGNSSEFVRDLIWREQARGQLRALVLEGMGSGEGSDVNGAYFDGLREQIRASAADVA